MFNIAITENEALEYSVNARDLHKGLEVETRFNDWIVRRLEEAQVVEGEDYITILKIEYRKKGRGTTNYKEYILSADCAKSICMLERTAIGKAIRRYFIACEKELRRQKELLTGDKDTRITELESENTRLREFSRHLVKELTNANEKLKVFGYPKKGLNATQIGTLVNMSAQKVNKVLCRMSFHVKRGSVWVATKAYADCKRYYIGADGEVHKGFIGSSFTPRGVEIALRMLRESVFESSPLIPMLQEQYSLI